MRPRFLYIQPDLSPEKILTHPLYKGALDTYRIITRQSILDMLSTSYLSGVPLIECLLQQKERLYTKNIIHANTVLVETLNIQPLFIDTQLRLFISSSIEDIYSIFFGISIGILECYAEMSHLLTQFTDDVWAVLPRYRDQPENLHRLTYIK